MSRRVQDTAFPVIVKTKQLMAQALPGRQVLSLAQGVVHWRPPPAAITAAAELMAVADGQGAIHSSEGGMRAVFGGGGVNSYGPADGLPALVDALQQKIADRNGLPGVSSTAACIWGLLSTKPQIATAARAHYTIPWGLIGSAQQCK